MDKLQILSFVFAVLLSITVHFIALRLRRAIMHQHTKIVMNLVQLFSRCQYYRWRFATTLNFKKSKILFQEEIWRTESRHHAKFCCGDIVIFLLFKMAAATIFIFRIREILLADGVQRAEAQVWVIFHLIAQKPPWRDFHQILHSC